MDMNKIREQLEQISKNDEEKQFEINGDWGQVPIPYSYVTDDSGKLNQLIRLLRKGVSPDTILLFYENHLGN